MNYITYVFNREKLVKALIQEGYNNFKNQLELDTYLGYESVFANYYQDNKSYSIPISVTDNFEKKPFTPPAVIKPKYELEKREERQVIRDAVSHLGERERIIIEMRYGLSGRREMTQKEVAQKLGISRSYVSRIEKSAVEKLRAGMK